MLPIWIDQEVEYVCSFDPAIDKENPDFNHAKYVETGDEKYLPIKQGEKPTKFVLRGVSRDVWKSVSADMLRSDMLPAFESLVRHGIVKAINFGDWKAERDKDGGLSKASMQPFRSIAWLSELGLRIQNLSSVPEK